MSLEDNVDCFKQKESDHFEIRQKDGKWKLKVWIDGTRFIVSDRDYIEKNNIERIPVSKRFSNDKLEQIGRKFIKDYLQDIVVLEPGEEIVPLWTEFELVSAMSENGEKVDDMITASMVHFGRKIDGINIVGGGSRISITVANNGAVVDVMLDWPRYRRSNEIQTAIGVSEIMERLFAYGKMVKGVNDVSLERFECGYYDPGVKYVDTYGFIQVGCVAYTVGLNKNEEGDFIHPVINVIPAGKIVEWDDNWPEAQAVINGRDLCEETDLSLCLKEY